MLEHYYLFFPFFFCFLGLKGFYGLWDVPVLGSMRFLLGRCVLGFSFVLFLCLCYVNLIVSQHGSPRGGVPIYTNRYNAACAWSKWNHPRAEEAPEELPSCSAITDSRTVIPTWSKCLFFWHGQKEGCRRLASCAELHQLKLTLAWGLARFVLRCKWNRGKSVSYYQRAAWAGGGQPAHSRGWDWVIFAIPSNPNCSIIVWLNYTCAPHVYMKPSWDLWAEIWCDLDDDILTVTK